MQKNAIRNRHVGVLLTSVATGVLLALTACAPQPEQKKVPSPTVAQRCEALSSVQIPGLRVLSAAARPSGFAADLGFGGMKSQPLPAHCEITAILQERTGQDGEPYAIRFHLRMPESWNGRMLFEGGGGTDGNLGTALGMINFRSPPAITTGYAVVSGDSGHSNEINNDPAKGGQSSFGRDAEARANYGHAALKATYDAAQAVIARFYEKTPTHNYYAGCSKGGQEGLAFAERYPNAFDGLLVGAPGMSLPRAALGHPWSAQAFAAAAGGDKGKPITIERLQNAYSDADLLLARKAILDACDGEDGLTDGIVGAFAQCSAKKVVPRLNALICKAGKTDACLSRAQVEGIRKFYAGPHDSKGEALYVSFPWDGGIGSADWRGWNIGSPVKPGMPPMMPGAGGPPMSVLMGASSLATIFSTPPKVLEPGLQPALNYLLTFDFDKDARTIYATSAAFPRSSWDDINARSPDLDAFRKHGGKLIVYHGASDPVFSINDTIAWYSEVDVRMGGAAAETVRLFAVPGMGHCQSGPATDQFDGFGALVSWVENGTPPDRMVATANPAAPWPNRERPLCPYPAIARYDGKGDIEKASSFVCAKPKAPN
jgi:feruloyl esterase